MRIDLDKLVKLLNLTQSPNEHEAISAMRKANMLLEYYDRTWGDLLGVTSAPPTRPDLTPGQRAAREKELAREKEIRGMLQNVLGRADLTKNTRDFVTSLSLQFGNRRHLSDRQYDMLRRIHSEK